MSASEALSTRRPLIQAVIRKGQDGGWVVTKVLVETHLIERSKEALEISEAIKMVDSDLSLETAIEALSFLTDAHGAIETSRKTVKEPFLKAGKLIDKEAGKLIDPLEQETQRIKSLVSRFQMDKVRYAQIKQAELERQSVELQRSANHAQDPERQEQLQEASHNLHLEARMVERPKVRGITVQPTYSARLDDFAKVANTNPHLLPQELNAQAVNDMIRALSDGGKRPLAPDAIPGITLIPTAKVSVRS